MYDRKFPKGPERDRSFEILIKSEKLKNRLTQSISNVNNYFDLELRLFHPNDVELIEIENKDCISNN